MGQCWLNGDFQALFTGDDLSPVYRNGLAVNNTGVNYKRLKDDWGV